MEPAAVLIGALEVQLGRPPEIGMRLQHRRVTAAGVEPHIEGVGALAEHRLAALAAPCARRQQLLLTAEVPLLDPAAPTEDLRDVLDDRLLEQQRLAAGAVEGGDRHAPHALAGERPVRPMRDHVEDAFLAPGGDPSDVAPDGVERTRAEAVLVEGHEPLLGGAEQRRVLAAPAVGIGMVEDLLGHQGAPIAEEVDDLGVRLPDRQPCKVRHLGDESPVVVHGVVDLEAKRPSELVVLLAVAGSDVDEPGAGVHGDEVGSCDLSMTVDPRVPVGAPHVVRAGQLRRDQPDLDAALRGSLEHELVILEPRLGDDVDLAAHVEGDIAL